jgi:hypothetical protein
MQKKLNHYVIIYFMIAAVLAGCKRAQAGIATQGLPPVRTDLPGNPISPEHQPSPNPNFSKYAFPISVDPNKRYLFYLHGKIIEEQGIPAVSPDFGEYEYGAILDEFNGYGFTVISEQRATNTDGLDYAKKVAGQIQKLLDAGVPPENISVIGASKGGGITIYVSHLLDNTQIRYVIMAICNPEMISGLKKSRITLTGKVLSIYDSADTLAGSCMDLFEFSDSKGLSESREIVLDVGIGHGILYKPLEEWVQPAVEWVQIK